MGLAHIKRQRLTILLVEDCEDDVLITRRALQEAYADAHALVEVHDGVEALEYLWRRGEYANNAANPRPDLILLDVNMPRMDGFEVLREVRKDPTLRLIPVVLLTSSGAEWDIRRAYELGANSYVVKPESFERTVQMMRVLCAYWSEVSALP